MHVHVHVQYRYMHSGLQVRSFSWVCRYCTYTYRYMCMYTYTSSTGICSDKYDMLFEAWHGGHFAFCHYGWIWGFFWFVCALCICTYVLVHAHAQVQVFMHVCVLLHSCISTRTYSGIGTCACIYTPRVVGMLGVVAILLFAFMVWCVC